MNRPAAQVGTGNGLPATLTGFHGLHSGETIIVCGCGASLNELHAPEGFITIGVNDVGRRFDPSYLVVLNPRQQFRNDRFRYVEQSRARAIFTQLDLDIRHPHLIRFRLGRRGGVELDASDRLPYTRNSPYVALCLALFMGARRIGLIGVDFTDHHFFAATGRHPLSNSLAEIDREYLRLARACSARGVEVVNLSRQSRLTAFPKQTLEQFLAQAPLDSAGQRRATGTTANRIADRSAVTMKVAIESYKPGIVGNFLDALAESARKLGYQVSRNPAQFRTHRDTVSVVWNGRHHRSAGPSLYCEHAWLPRWEYQISPRGINAASHIAPFVWDHKPLNQVQQAELDHHLDSIRRGGPENYSYMQTAAAPTRDLPEAFLLVPLQMEQDTNILHHVPSRFRHMQALVDFISQGNPPLPVVYKQHPADINRGNRQLQLRLKRRQDSIRPHREGNIHQLLKSGRCRGIVALNSNVVHDGLIWNIPAIVLGNNIWPREGTGPFLTTLPEDWEKWFDSLMEPEVVACRRAYAYYLMKNQWKLEDVHNPEKVKALFTPLFTAQPQARTTAGKGNRRTTAKSATPTINVAAVNCGWFFEDLKRHFLAAQTPKARITVSERPRRDADAWIFIRTKEAVSSPKPDRTVVQIHDMFNEILYRPGRERHCVSSCAAVALTHPQQRSILESAGISLENKLVLDRPIGALRSFTLRPSLPEKFTVAWVGRPVKHFGEELKRVDWFIDAVQQIRNDIRVVLLGERLESQFHLLRQAKMDCHYLQRAQNPIENYPQHYRAFDCVVISSSSEAGPLCLFEALATGVPVVSTRVGWSPLLIRDGQNGFLIDSIEEMVEAIRTIRCQRQAWFEGSEAIRQSLGGYTLEGWVEENIAAALGLAVIS